MAHPYRRLLQDRDVSTLWAGVTISSIGSELYAFGAIWLAVSIAGAEGSLLATARFATILVMSVAAGAFVDLLPRRVLLIGADLVRAGIAATSIIGGTVLLGAAMIGVFSKEPRVGEPE